jgi:hypothetical protein
MFDDHNELASQLKAFIEREKGQVDKLKQDIANLQQKLNERLAKFEPATKLLEQLEGIAKTEPVTRQTSQLPENEFSKLSITKAGIRVLQETKRKLSSAELVNEIKKRGKPMKSPHSVYMVSQALKNASDKVRRIKVSGVNYFELVKEEK